MRAQKINSLFLSEMQHYFT